MESQNVQSRKRRIQSDSKQKDEAVTDYKLALAICGYSSKPAIARGGREETYPRTRTDRQSDSPGLEYWFVHAARRVIVL